MKQEQRTKLWKFVAAIALALSALARRYVEIEQYVKALQIAKTTQNSSFNKAIVILSVAIKYAETGEKVDKGVRKVLKEIVKEVELENKK